MTLEEFCKMFNISESELAQWRKEKPNLYNLLMNEKERIEKSHIFNVVQERASTEVHL